MAISIFEYIKKLIDNPGLTHLKFSCAEMDGDGLLSITKHLSNHDSFKSLRVIEVDGSVLRLPLSVINEILTMNIIVQQRLFLIGEFIVDYEKEETKNFLSLFDKLCKNIILLCVDKEIPINITVQFKNIEKDEKIFVKCNSVYTSHFSEKKLNLQYKERKNIRNQYFQSLEKIKSSFEFTYCHVLEVKNATNK